MSYFALALLALVLGEGLMAAGYGFPSAPIQAPQTLVLVHLVAIGWLSLLLCGALFQFVPVLVAHPLHSQFLPLPTLVLLVAGLGALLAGFLQLAGAFELTPHLLPCAALLLTLGFALALYNLGRTLWEARPLPLPARFVAVALVCLVVTVAFGAVFAVSLALPVQSTALLNLAGLGLPLHIVAGLGGWLTFAAMGVSYRLLAMFMLAPDPEGPRPRAALWLGMAALAVAIIGGTASALFAASIFPALLIGGALGVAALVLYGADVVRLYRARKRRVIELNSQMAAFALGSLAASVVLGAVLLALGRFGEQIGALVFLVAFGWLSGLGLAKLYKIVAFITWLESYGPILGKAPTPRVQDLVIEPRARKWFFVFFVAVWCGTAALLAGQTEIFRLAAAAMALATLSIAVQITRTRCLSDVAVAKRLPEGARRPHLLISQPNRS